MVEERVGGYAGKVLRVNLTNRTLTEEHLDHATLRKWVGGVGLGAKYLYEEVSPKIDCLDPENRLIFTAGPMSGTRVGGSGTLNVVTKGCLTNGATSSQANGFMGAYMKFSGYDAIVVQGVAPEWLYLYLHDGMAELRDASHLVGKDVWETEELIKKECGQGKHNTSVYAIGPAGENLVRFAAIVGDGGHVAAHNGVGAVMGSKRLKGIAAKGGKGSVSVYDPGKVSLLVKEMWEKVKKNEIFGTSVYKWGTMASYIRAESRLQLGQLPVKNLTTNVFPEAKLFSAEYLRSHHEVKRTPCWACQQHHVHRMKILEGPYAGLTAEEPEWEAAAAWGPLIGNPSPESMIFLNDVTDRLGMDANEAGWLVAMVIELFEKGVLTRQNTDGLDMKWGNVEAVRDLLYKIALREGFGDLLAEGVMRAAQKLGKKAMDCAVFLNKGSTPAGHDHRAMWPFMFDLATASTGNYESLGLGDLKEMGISTPPDYFSAQFLSELAAKGRGRRQFEDCIGTCYYCTAVPLTKLVETLNAITGWNMTTEEAQKVGFRVSNVLRAYNFRCGITPDVEVPSKRYWSTPVDGAGKGITIKPVWNEMLDNLHKIAGWDRNTGRPLPETLRELGLDHIIKDIW